MIIWAACCQSTSAVANSVISFATLTNIVKVAENKTKQKTAITTTKMCSTQITAIFRYTNPHRSTSLKHGNTCKHFVPRIILSLR